MQRSKQRGDVFLGVLFIVAFILIIFTVGHSVGAKPTDDLEKTLRERDETIVKRDARIMRLEDELHVLKQSYAQEDLDNSQEISSLVSSIDDITRRLNGLKAPMISRRLDYERQVKNDKIPTTVASTPEAVSIKD